MISFEQALSNNKEKNKSIVSTGIFKKWLTVCVIGLENPLITNIQQQWKKKKEKKPPENTSGVRS